MIPHRGNRNTTTAAAGISRCRQSRNCSRNSVRNALKNQLGLERHGGRIPAGLWARIIERLLALNAVIWHNWIIGAPVKRSLIAYDH
jgi:hypothetical protein